MEEACRDWNAGIPWSDIAEAHGFTNASGAMMAVRRYAKRNGVELRYANGRPDAARRAKSAELYERGFSLREIAIACDWSDGGAAWHGIDRHRRDVALRAVRAPRVPTKE